MFNNNYYKIIIIIKHPNFQLSYVTKRVIRITFCLTFGNYFCNFFQNICNKFYYIVRIFFANFMCEQLTLIHVTLFVTMNLLKILKNIIKKVLVMKILLQLRYCTEWTRNILQKKKNLDGTRIQGLFRNVKIDLSFLEKRKIFHGVLASLIQLNN